MRFLFSIPVLLSLGLAGCITTDTGGTSNRLPPEVMNVVTEIKDATKAGCQYEPTVETIANVLSAIGVPYVGMVATVASQFCSVVTKFGARRGGKRMMAVRSQVTGKVRAIEVKGQFVR